MKIEFGLLNLDTAANDTCQVRKETTDLESGTPIYSAIGRYFLAHVYRN